MGRIFGPKREEVVRACRRLHNEELHNLYVSPSIFRMTMSRRMRCVCNMHGRDEKCIQYFDWKSFFFLSSIRPGGLLWSHIFIDVQLTFVLLADYVKFVLGFMYSFCLHVPSISFDNFGSITGFIFGLFHILCKDTKCFLLFH
jgi:hypothetical protein